MNAKLVERGEKRGALVARAAVRYLRGNPMVLGGVAAFLVALRPWRTVKWLPPGWLLWHIARMALGTKGIPRGF